MASAAKKLIPLLDRVLIEKVAARTKTVGGILLPETAASKARRRVAALTALERACVCWQRVRARVPGAHAPAAGVRRAQRRVRQGGAARRRRRSPKPCHAPRDTRRRCC
jgi:hypothetical protein